MAISYISSGRSLSPNTSNPATLGKNTPSVVDLVVAYVWYQTWDDERSGGLPTWDGNTMTEMQPFDGISSGLAGGAVQAYYLIDTTGGPATFLSVPNTTNESLFLTIAIYGGVNIEFIEKTFSKGADGTPPYEVTNYLNPVNGDLVIQNSLTWNSAYDAEPIAFSGIERWTDDLGGVSDYWGSSQDDTISILTTECNEQMAFISVWAGFAEGGTNVPPSTPILVSPPSGSTVGTTPAVTFYSIDDNYDDITYQIQIDDTDNTFGSVVIDVVSSADTGFTNISITGTTDPFPSAHEIEYQVQGGDALSNGVEYWWRGRAIDPSGTTTWSAWNSSETARSFIVATGELEPTLSQDTADATVFTTGNPSLLFTGYDGNDDDLTYEIRVDDDVTFSAITFSAASATDLGFGTVSLSFDTDPFDAGAQIEYTVQSGDTLSDGTYYWQARVKDPSGSDTWTVYGKYKYFIIDTTDDEWDTRKLLNTVKISGNQVTNLINISGNILPDG